MRMQSEKPEQTTRTWVQALECPVDEDADYRNTFWCNRDLIPIPYDRRTWTWQGFSGYWVITGKSYPWVTARRTLLRYRRHKCDIVYDCIESVGAWLDRRTSDGRYCGSINTCWAAGRDRWMDGFTPLRGLYSLISRVCLSNVLKVLRIS